MNYITVTKGVEKKLFQNDSSTRTISLHIRKNPFTDALPLHPPLSWWFIPRG